MRLVTVYTITLLILTLFNHHVSAQGMAGLEYTAMVAGGPTPTRTTSGRTIVGTGISPNINYDWGGGAILGTNRSEGVIVRWTGFIRWPGNGSRSVTFYNRSDDGFSLQINNTMVIDNWREQGPALYNGAGSHTLTGGQVYNIEIWYYENGGGAVAQLFWDIGAGIVLVPTEELATSSTFWAPSLCCGGSAAQFNANPQFSSRAQSFIASSSYNNVVYIEQIGNNNTVDVTQQGTRNYSEYRVTGSNNTGNIVQNTTNGSNYIEVTLQGSNNVTSISQSGADGARGVLATIASDGNNINVQQNTGSHYAEINLLGGNKTVNLTQSGSASHMARIELSGGSTSITTTQMGSIQQHYSITHSCATQSCAAITVTQGQ